MENTIEHLMNILPNGSYESGWTQPMLSPIGKGSMIYQNGLKFAVKQNNWRTKDERIVYGVTVLETLENYISQFGNETNAETSKSESLEF